MAAGLATALGTRVALAPLDAMLAGLPHVVGGFCDARIISIASIASIFSNGIPFTFNSVENKFEKIFYISSFGQCWNMQMYFIIETLFDT